MSKTFIKIFAAITLIAGVLAVTPGPAQARYWGHGHHGGWGGSRFYFGGGYPYPYYRPYYRSYYYGPDCGYVRVRVWRHGYWRLRRILRCY